MEHFLEFTRLNEQGADCGPVWINPEHVVSVMGEETATAVRVLTVAGEVRLAQPQGPDAEGKDQPSVIAQLGGRPAPRPKATKE